MFTRKKKFFVLSTALLVVSYLFLVGCSSEETRQNTPSNNSQTPSSQNSTNMSPNNNGMNGVNGATNNTQVENRTAESNLHQRAEKIADALVTDINAVKDARVIISDKMAYVSVSIDETADADTAKTLKEDVAQVVKKTDTSIEDVYVMEDADTFTRMKEMVEDIADGRPISGFADELENMFTRVMPSKE